MFLVVSEPGEGLHDVVALVEDRHFHLEAQRRMMIVSNDAPKPSTVEVRMEAIPEDAPDLLATRESAEGAVVLPCPRGCREVEDEAPRGEMVLVVVAADEFAVHRIDDILLALCLRELLHDSRLRALKVSLHEVMRQGAAVHPLVAPEFWTRHLIQKSRMRVCPFIARVVVGRV